MKVLHYITGISPTIGGIEKFVLNYYTKKDEEIEIEILTRYCDKTTLMYQMFEEKGITIHTLNIHHLGMSNMLVFHHRLQEFFSKHTGEYDILHTHGIIDPFVVTLAKRNGVERVFTHVHSYIISGRKLSNIVKKISAYRNSIQADLCIACSMDIGKIIYPKCCYKKLIEMVNGINTKEFEYSPEIREDCRAQLHLDNSFVLCNVSRMEPIKNHYFLLDIFKHLLEKKDKSVLMLIGDGTLKADLEEYTNSIGVSSNVLFLGERENVSDLLQASDAFVMPSKSEGLGISAIEAQASGLMTFVSKDVVPNSVDCTGLVSFISIKKTADEWAEIILRKTSNTTRRSQYKKICNTEYDNAYLAKRLDNLYKGMIDENNN